MSEQPTELVPVVADEQTRMIRQGELSAMIDAVRGRPARSMRRVIERVSDEIRISPDVAEHMYYALPRDGKTVLGASIEMAEAIQRHMGGLAVATRFLPVEVERVTAQAIAYDLESLNVIEQPAAVRITRKDGSRYNADMIATAQASAGAKARRNAILALVPRYVLRELVATATKTAGGDEKTLAQRRRDAVQWFDGRGVPLDVLLRLLRVDRIEDITIDGLATIRGLASALRSGEITVEALGVAATKAATLGTDPTAQDIQAMLSSIMDETVTASAAAPAEVAEESE